MKNKKLCPKLVIKGTDSFCDLIPYFIFLLLPILIVGCGKHGEIIGGPFSDNQLLMDTEFDGKLIRSAVLTNCLDSLPLSFRETQIKYFEKSLMRTYHELFPAGSSATTVITILELAGAQCLEEKNSKKNAISCKLKKEYIYGIKGLYLLGWETFVAFLAVNIFEYLIVAQDDRILNVSVRSISSECFELDKKLYDQSKKVKPIRRL